MYTLHTLYNIHYIHYVVLYDSTVCLTPIINIPTVSAKNDADIKIGRRPILSIAIPPNIEPRNRNLSIIMLK